MMRCPAGSAAIVVFCLLAPRMTTQAQEASQDIWSPGRIIGDIGESTGLHDKVPPAPDFVVKTRPPDWELDYRPLDPTQAETPTDVNAAARAAGRELDAAKAANRRLATGVAASAAARKPASSPKKGMDPFDAGEEAATN